MGCLAFDHDAHVREALVYRANNAAKKAVESPVAKPQTSDNISSVANNLIHDLYSDAFIALSKV